MATAMLRTVLAAAAMAAGAPANAADRGELVTFDRYGSLSANLELARRTMTPLIAAQLPARLTAIGKGLREQPVDLTAETFRLRVPVHQPAAGYGLLVFVAPWDDAVCPRRWGRVLDETGTIFITAARSGNDHDVRGRRMPLALLAAFNVMARYRIDPARVYAAGFSGGSRIAERLAVAYPDLFRGAILNSGSDPLGGVVAVPPRDLFDRFRRDSRLVYITGEHDTITLGWDSDSTHSLRTACALNLARHVMAGRGHELIDDEMLARAFRELTVPARDGDRAAACSARLDTEIAGELDRVEALAAAGRRGEASTRLAAADKRHGGLAAPRSLALAVGLATP